MRWQPAPSYYASHRLGFESGTTPGGRPLALFGLESEAIIAAALSRRKEKRSSQSRQ